MQAKITDIRLNRGAEPSAMLLSLISPIYFLFPLLLLGLYILAAAVRILSEYERAVVFTLGRFERVNGPGLVLLLPFVQ